MWNFYFYFKINQLLAKHETNDKIFLKYFKFHLIQIHLQVLITFFLTVHPFQ